MVVYFLDASSKGNCKYALDRSSFEKDLPPVKRVNSSSAVGKGYVSVGAAWLTVIL